MQLTLEIAEVEGVRLVGPLRLGVHEFQRFLEVESHGQGQHRVAGDRRQVGRLQRPRGNQPHEAMRLALQRQERLAHQPVFFQPGDGDHRGGVVQPEHSQDGLGIRRLTEIIAHFSPGHEKVAEFF